MTRFERLGPLAVTLFAIAACAGGGSPQSPQSSVAARYAGGASVETLRSTATASTLTQTLDGSDLSPAKVFVSDGAANAIFVYNAAGKRIGRIANDSGFLATDSAQTLYVVHSSPTAAVDIYAKPYSGRPFTIVPPEYPVAVAIAPGSRMLAVSEIISASGGPGSVIFYRHGEAKPCATVTLTSAPRAYFDAFDAEGNLFVDGSDATGNTVVSEIVGGCHATGYRLLSTGNVIDFPGGVAVDERDRILVDDQSGLAIYTYAHPKGAALGNPIITTPLSAGDPLTFVLADGAHDTWVVDASNSRVSEYVFPRGGSPIAVLDAGGQPNGVAVVPAVFP